MLVILFTLPASANMIDTKSIYVNKEYISLDLSPNGKYILASNYKDGKQSVILINPLNQQKVKLFEILQTKHNHLKGYGWIDNNNVYVQYGKVQQSRNTYNKFEFINLKNDSLFVSRDSFTVSLKGYIIDPLADQNENLVFAKYNKKTDSYNAYKTTITQIKEEDVDESDPLNKGLSDAFVFIFDQKNLLRLVKIYKNETASFYYRENNNSEWRMLLSVNQDDDYFVPLEILANNNLLAISDIGRDKRALVEIDTDSGMTVKIHYQSPNYDLVGAKINPKTLEVEYIAIIERGRLEYKYLDTEFENKFSELKSRHKGKNIFQIDESLDKSKSIYLVSDSDLPGTYYYFDQQTKISTSVLDIYPQLNQFEFRPTIAGTTENEGHSLEYLLTLPKLKQNAKAPLVVMPHGGPIGVRDSNNFDKDIQILANRGYAVLRVNFRGSFGYGKKFRKQGVGQWGLNIESDINAALETIIKEYPIDNHRICAAGASYGGYSAIMLTINAPQLYQCAISSFGVSDITLLYSASNKHYLEKHKNSLNNVLGKLDKKQQQQLSPVYLASSIQKPVLIIVGEKDRVAHPEHSNRLKYLMQKMSKPVEFISYPESEHGHVSWDAERHSIIRILEFLDRNLDYHRNNDLDALAILKEEYEFMSQQSTSGILIRPSDIEKQLFDNKLKEVVNQMTLNESNLTDRPSASAVK
jgi:dipeptidyl aminopeptidase/acylaminoacyl peptidase